VLSGRRLRGASCLHRQDCVSWSADEDSTEAQCDILPIKSSTLPHDCQEVTESDDERTVLAQSDTYLSDTLEKTIDCGMSTTDEGSFKVYGDVVSLMTRMKCTFKTTKLKSHCAAIY
jgi:hypothetical protein